MLKKSLSACLLMLPAIACASPVIAPSQIILLAAIALTALGMLILLPWAVVRTLQRNGTSDARVNQLLFALLGYILLTTLINLGVTLALPSASSEGIPWPVLVTLAIVNGLRWPVMILVVALSLARRKSSTEPDTRSHMLRHAIHAAIYVSLSAVLMVLQHFQPALIVDAMRYAPAIVLALLVSWHYRAVLRSPR